MFNPSTVKDIFSILKNVDKNFIPRVVYDPCSGWGDRMLGFLATESVTHIRYNDANETLEAPYLQLLDCHNTGQNKVRHHGSFAAAEDLTIGDLCSFQEPFDAWVTGLPFGDLERYPGKILPITVIIIKKI